MCLETGRSGCATVDLWEAMSHLGANIKTDCGVEDVGGEAAIHVLQELTHMILFRAGEKRFSAATSVFLTVLCCPILSSCLSDSPHSKL